MADPGRQLEIQQQINQVLQDRQKLLVQQTNLLTSQAQIAKQLCGALECRELDGLEERLNKIKENEGITQLTEELNETSAAANQAAADMDKLKKAAALGAIVGFAGGVKAAFGGVISTIKNTISVVGTLVQTFARVGMAIVSIPFRILNGLVDMAQMGGGGANELRQALEEVRKEFGDIASNEGLAITASLKTVRGEMGKLTKHGLSMYRTFGMGRTGMANYLKAVAELAKELGPAFGLLKKEIKENAFQFTMLRKGLGITAKAQADVMLMAKNFGKDPLKIQKRFAQAAIRVGKATGTSSKVIGKAMGEMVESFEHFGTMAPEHLAAVAGHAHKLGVEIKSLTGIMDTFDDFAKGADAATQLSHAYGVVIDHNRLFEETDPSKKVVLLQKAFTRAGVSTDNMHRSLLRHIGGLIGADSKTVALMFSQRGMATSYDDVKDAAEGAGEKHKSFNEIMKDLAKNIERLVHGGGGKFTSFFDAFKKGFIKGIYYSKEFRKVFRNIYKALRITYRAGMRIAAMFAATFPGVAKMADGLAGLFSPKRFRKMLRGVEAAFKDLFLILSIDPNAGFEGFMQKMGKVMGEWFGGHGRFLMMIKIGLKLFGTAMAGLFGQMIRGLFPLLTTALNGFAEFIRTGTLDGLRNMLPPDSVFMPVINALQDVGPALADAIGNVFKSAFERAKPTIMKYLHYYVAFVFGKFMLTIIASTIQGAISGLMTAGIIKMALAGALGGGIPGVPGFGGKGGGQMPGPKGPPKSGGGVMGSFKSMAKGMASADFTKTIGRFGFNLTLITLAVLVPLGIFVAGMVGIVKLAKPLASKDALYTFGSIGIMLIAMGTLAIAVEKFTRMSERRFKRIPQALKALALTGLLTLALAGIARIVVGVFGGIEPTKILSYITNLGMFLLTMGGIFTAALLLGALAVKATPLIPMVLIGLAGLGVIAYASGKLLTTFSDELPAMDEAKANVLQKSADAVFTLVSAMMKIVSVAFNPNAIQLGVVSAMDSKQEQYKASFGVVDTLSKLMGQFVPKIMASISAVDPSKSLAAAKAFGAIMKGIAPMFVVAASLVDLGGELAKIDKGQVFDTSKGKESLMGRVFGKISDTFSSMSYQVKGLIDSMVGISVSKKQLNVLKGVTPLIGAMAAVFKNVGGPIMKLTEAAVDMDTMSETVVEGGMQIGSAFGGHLYKGGDDTTTTSTTKKRFRETKFMQAMGTLGAIIPAIMAGFAGSMETMMRAVARTPSFSGKEGKAILQKFKTLTTVMKSLGAMTGLVKALLDLPLSSGEKKEISKSDSGISIGDIGIGALFKSTDSKTIEKTAKTGAVDYAKNLGAMTTLLLGEDIDGNVIPGTGGGIVGIAKKVVARLMSFGAGGMTLDGKKIDPKVALKAGSVMGKVIGGFSEAVSKSFKNKGGLSEMANIFTAFDKMIGAYERIMLRDVSGDEEKAKALYRSILRINAAFDAVVDEEKLKVIEPFKGGNLTVKHQHSSMKVHVAVNINAKQLAKALVEVKDLGGTRTGQGIATEAR